MTLMTHEIYIIIIIVSNSWSIK